MTPRCAGLVQDSEGRRLAELARSVPVDQAIVEIGSHTGLSTCWMADSTKAHIIAVDPWGDPRPGTLDDPFALVTGDAVLARFMDNIRTEGHGQRVTPIRTVSTVAASMWVKPVGLVFIDAIHEREHVIADYEAWAPFVAPGGWLAFHDWAPWPEHPYYGVTQAIEEVVIPSGLWSEPVIVDALWTAHRLA